MAALRTQGVGPLLPSSAQALDRAAGTWKVLSWSTDLLSFSLIHPLGFCQSWGSRSVTPALPASAPAPPSGWPGALVGALQSSRWLGWAATLCFFPSSNLHKEHGVMLRLTPELQSLHQCRRAELVSSEPRRPQKRRDSESTEDRARRGCRSARSAQRSICRRG